MTSTSRPMREMYERYLAGKVSFEELKRRIDERTDEYLRRTETEESPAHPER